MAKKDSEGVAAENIRYQSAPHVSEEPHTISLKSVGGRKSFLLRNQQASQDFNPECIRNTRECKLMENVETVRCNNYDTTDIPEVENFEVKEPRLGTTSRSSSQLTEFLDNAIRKPLISRNRQLGAITTRSSPRLASGSAVDTNGALDLPNITSIR